MSIVDDLIPHMRRVQAADRDLHDLSLVWQTIEAASAISCPEDVESILPTLTQTRERFENLQARLVKQLGAETLAELGDELASTAQCTIDILVRNLYERTADVGFLATDDVLRAFCTAAPAARDAGRAALVQHLAEYRAKYTVYDDIIVLGPDGSVLARLDTAASLASSADAIVAQAAARAGHVERFAATDLAVGGAPALLYGHRIADAAGRCIGVLVLRFRNADELERIFTSVGQGGADNQRQMALLLIDDEGRVIVSNDESHIPLGARLQTSTAGQVAVSMFGGREYLSVTCATRGYQGYNGPGWRAHAMVSLLTAFRNRHDGVGEQPQVSLDNKELHQIQSDVDAINRNLRRVVWNGHVVAGSREGNPSRLKAVLEQVNSAGTRTRDRVAVAIRDLYRTSLARAHHQAREMARLAADIMDRNLYERANDCRWWALSPGVQRVLAAPADAAGSEALNAVLAHINGLYTVYSRLVAFDADGTVRGVSNDDAEHSLLGSTVEADLLAAAAALGDSQRYAVSAFAASPLSGGVPTYIYSAAVREGGRFVGGIAIVFNAEREFRAILDDVLGSRAGLACFVDGEGRIVASTDPGLAVGQALPFDAAQQTAEHADSHLAVARVVAAGYREFKRGDGYQNHVRAVVALRLGAAERRRVALYDRPLRALPTAARAAAREFALFQTGPGRFALPASAVLEACSVQGLVRTPSGAPHALGLLDVAGSQDPCVIPVFCGRSLFGVNGPPRPGDGVVLVMCAPWDPRRPLLGLRVDDVLCVADVGPEHLQDPPAGLRQHAPMLNGLLRMQSSAEGEAEVLIQLIDADAITALAGAARMPASTLAPAVATA
jgi:chemotaxis signal transduction protein